LPSQRGGTHTGRAVYNVTAVGKSISGKDASPATSHWAVGRGGERKERRKETESREKRGGLSFPYLLKKERITT